MVLENDCFRKKIFKNVPSRIFTKNQKHSAVDGNTLEFDIVRKKEGTTAANLLGHPNETICIKFANPSNCTCYDPSHCDWRWCPTGDCYHQLCWSYYYNDDPNNPDLPPGPPVSGGGGGYGGDPGGGSQIPICTGSWYDPDPCENPESNIVDENDFYVDRLDELESMLAIDEDAIMPCPTFPKFTQMAQQYFQSLATFTPSQTVKSRIADIIATNSNFTLHNFFIQTLDNAAGPKVNCDFFRVNITYLPIINGTRLTSEEFLEYFRLHMTDFAQPITSSSPATFSPYNAGGLDETGRWNMPYGGSLTSLIHIPLVAVNDGTVMETDYETGGTNKWYTFSTMHSPLDDYHPVSGNRRFGIAETDPGHYMFYIAGVDRISTKGIGLGNSLGKAFGVNGFQKAIELWRKFQTNLISFINSNGGAANYPSVDAEFTSLPNWADVEAYLKKQIDYPELKRRLGC
jgi:hypothetical protein